MPQIVLCPSCKMKLSLTEENLGKSVRCPGCKSVFNTPGAVVPAAPNPPRPAPSAGVGSPESPDNALLNQMSEEVLQSQSLGEEEMEEFEEPDEEQEEQDRQENKFERRGWKNVRFGVLCVLMALLISFVLSFASAYLLTQGRESISLGLSLSLIGSFLGGSLTAFGQGLCCSVPRSTGGKGLTAAAAALNLLSFLIWGYGIVTVLNAPPGRPGMASQVLEWIGFAFVICGVFGTFFWFLFLYHVSSSLGARGAGIAVGVLGLLAVLYVIGVIVRTYETRLQGLIGRQGELSAELLLIVFGGLLLLLYYVCLLAVIAGVIGKRIAQLRRG